MSENSEVSQSYRFNSLGQGLNSDLGGCKFPESDSEKISWLTPHHPLCVSLDLVGVVFPVLSLGASLSAIWPLSQSAVFPSGYHIVYRALPQPLAGEVTGGFAGREVDCCESLLPSGGALGGCLAPWSSE
jgi:hypothetical protein